MTKRARDTLRSIGLHTALLAGSVLFAFPFVWLVTTTFKDDTEIFTERINWIPKIPYYSQSSPYTDQRAYRTMRRPSSMSAGMWRDVEPALQTALWRRAQELAPQAGVELDPSASEQVVRGLWEQVRDTLPAEAMAGSAEAVGDAAAEAVLPETLTTVWNRVHKRCMVGRLRVLNAANEDLLTGEQRSNFLWLALNGELAQTPTEVDGESGRVLRYADSPNDCGIATVLAATGELERVSLGLRDDESWRKVSLLIMTPRGTFRSARPFVMGNGEWQDVTWTFTPPRDRRSLEIPLEPVDAVGGHPDDLWDIRVTIQPTTASGAVFEKFARNYREAMRYVPFWSFAKNSVVLVVLNILGQLFACSMVAYAFSRLRWPGRDIVFVVLLSTMMLPPQVTMVPVFLIVRKLHWYNTLLPLWLPSFFGSAFFIFLLRQFLLTIPKDLEDAAKIDGCSYLGLYWTIMLPLIKPALAAVAIFQFLGSWNDFMGPLIYINDLRLTPLSLGLFQFQQEHTAEWGMLMAGSLLMTLPAILIFFFAQKYFIQGVTLTGMKG